MGFLVWAPSLFLLHDMTLTMDGIAQQIKWIDIGKWIYSAHTHVCMLWVLCEHRRLGKLWRLDYLILEANGLGPTIEKEIKLFKK